MDKTYYTIRGKTDGFGAQYQAIMSGLAYCNYHRYIYVHTPFKQIEHGVDVAQANEFIGIEEDTGCYEDVKIYAEEYSHFVHIFATPSIFYNEQTLSILRNYYNKNEKPVIDNIDIAIHIRRGDVSYNKNKERYVDDEFYRKIIRLLKIKYPKYSITIFSEGKYKDFRRLKLDEKCFRLNEDVFKTFHSLVKAKVLIQSLSSFSYSAGILNENQVYWMDGFWSYKLDHWKNISDLFL